MSLNCSTQSTSILDAKSWGQGSPPARWHPFPYGIMHQHFHQRHSGFCILKAPAVFSQPPGRTNQTIPQAAVWQSQATPWRGTARWHRPSFPLLRPPTASGARGTSELGKENKSADNSSSCKGDFRGVAQLCGFPRGAAQPLWLP